MISEGPALIEALPGELQAALNGALQPGEELLIAVRGNQREAFAATRERMLLLKEPAITGVSPVEVREVPVSTVSNVRAEPRPVGGRLMWDSTRMGAPTQFEYPTYDASKYSLVAKRLQQLTGGAPEVVTPGVKGSADGRACPKCQSTVPAGACWCPNCGLQVLDPCWECGAPLTEGANFCAFCGTANTEPAVVHCPECQAPVARGFAYCPACGAQARVVCAECDRPMRKEWKACPACGGEPVWDAGGVSPQVAHLQGEPDDPSAWLQTRPVVEAANAESLNAAAVKAYEAGNYQEAVRFFRQATDADPRNASYWTNLGVAYGELDNDEEALAAYRRAVEINPREVAAYLNIGYLYMEQERTSEAREVWEQVIRIAPDSDEAAEARENLKSQEDV